MTALDDLAAACGVEPGYTDANGKPRLAPPEAVMAALRALGHEVDRPMDARGALARLRREEAARAVEPVAVAWDGRLAGIPLRLPRADRDALLRVTLEGEGGLQDEWAVRVGELPERTREVAGRTLDERLLPMPPDLPLGVHALMVEVDGIEHRTTLLSAATRGARSWDGPEKVAGVVAPVWTLRRPGGWGTGDLTDLEALAQSAARHGATVVGTLPLLPGPPDDASPYRPLSRRFWSDLWIDPERVPDLAWSAVARGMVQDAAARKARAEADASTLARRDIAAPARRAVIETLSTSLVEAPPSREAAFRNFLLERPEVSDWARFRAASERFGDDWREWPGHMRDGDVRFADVDPSRERYHAYAQWVAEEQVAELSRGMARAGQVLLLDLPVGVHPDGYDVWRQREAFVSGASLGAPADAFFAGGQGWGVPALHPQGMRASGHAYLRACLAHHLRHAKLLRIDHAIGLHRAFWVPDGMSALDGLYVRMPAEELYACLAIEAQRARADIVGEDLGNVPDELREAMERHALRSTWCGQFSLRPSEDPPLVEPSPGGMAAFGSHDLPSFASWLAEEDLDERLALGVNDQAQDVGAREGRAAERAALERLAGSTEPRAVLDGLHGALAASDAGLALTTLDDLLLAPGQENLPGTSHERANWTRRIAQPVDESLAGPAGRSLAALAQGRTAPARPRGRWRPRRAPETVFGVSLLGRDDLRALAEGRHARLYRVLGAHPLRVRGVGGTAFGVWAPNAEAVSVVGDFNGWDGSRHPLRPRESSGIWEGFVPGVARGALYKYRLRLADGREVEKADPIAFRAEPPPRTASVVWGPDHAWGDREWMQHRHERNRHDAPVSTYEVHLGSWRRMPEEGNRSLSYTEIAAPLVEHVRDHGFTHVELLPVMEHPFYGSWGYQATGYFAPTSRHGAPEDLMALIDALHQADIGVLLDWPPAHFPADDFALGLFDGTHLYEHHDHRRRVHPDWGSWQFDLGRPEVRSFLLSSALFWLDRYHADGIRVDAVASMLYLDYSRGPGQWTPNRHGGNEDLEALDFLRAFNTEVYAAFPDTMTVAEESTAWPGVSKPVWAGGLGFGFKWDMGWMHDTLRYLARDPVHRAWHQDELTFRQVYASSENFVMPLSHDEVVHGKGSLLTKMPGDPWQRFANLRLLYGYQWCLPGKKLLFQGGEVAQWAEWDHERSVDWHLLAEPAHAGIARWVARLNAVYQSLPALHQGDVEPDGLVWISANDREQSVLAWERRGRDGAVAVCVVNLTPVPREDYRLGLPHAGGWDVVANSDAPEHGGSGYPVPDVLMADGEPWHDRAHSAALSLPPLGVLVLSPAG